MLGAQDRALDAHIVARTPHDAAAPAPYERQPHGDPLHPCETAAADGEVSIAALVGRVLRLQHEISGLAGDVADAETQVGSAYRRLAERDPARSAQYLAAADEADRYAAHKREEQRRWRLT